MSVARIESPNLPVAHLPCALRCSSGADVDGRELSWVEAGLRRALPHLRIREYFASKPDILSSSDLVVIASEHDSGECEAVLAARWHRERHPFLHLTTLLVGARYQRSSLVRRMLALMWERLAAAPEGLPVTVALRTYNPSSYAAIRAFSRIGGVRLYPNVHGGEQEIDLRQLAAQIAPVISPECEFRSDTGVVVGGAGSVPSDFYPEMPSTSDGAVNDYFCRVLRPVDRLLCVLVVESRSAQARILKTLGAPPRG